MNLQHLLELYFRTHSPLLSEERVRALLDSELDIAPDDLAIYIYRAQVKLLEWYGEARTQTLLTQLWYLQRILTQSEIFYTAKIGDDFKFNHGLGTVIGARVTIGNAVTVYQGVTIGGKNDGDAHRPIIGDHSIIYAGSRVLGAITLGKYCVVGANSLVLDSFPDYAVVAGIPARLLYLRVHGQESL